MRRVNYTIKNMHTSCWVGKKTNMMIYSFMAQNFNKTINVLALSGTSATFQLTLNIDGNIEI